MKELIETTLEEARQTLESFLEETTTVGIISQAASTCAEALKAGNKFISCVMEVLYVTPPTLQKN